MMKNTKQPSPRGQNGLFRAALKAVAVMALACSVQAAEQSKPNIIYILADDWGLGDVKTYGGDRCKIDTPHMDQLAAKGMKFTDAHTSSSVCTPSRYSVITGRYNFRKNRASGILTGYGAAKIKPGRETVASMLKQNGYATGMVGKWHIGMNLPTTDGKPARGKADKKKGTVSTNIDWNGTITEGPYDVGFDYYYGISASLDMPPYVWIENNRFTEPGTKPNDMCRPGPQGESFVFSDVLPKMTRKSVAWIQQQAKSEKPFFLYMALASPHTPLVASDKFKGKSQVGPYGDLVMETDWSVGEVVKAVEQAGIADNTLIIVTADNGCSPEATIGLKDKTKIQFRMDQPVEENPEAHYPSDIYRGYKADIYEGGHRVPYIARWDGKVKAGSVSDDTICLVDLYATCADIVGAKIPDTAAEDSVSTLPIMLGTATGPIHEAVVHHSYNGYFAIRKGKWKLIFGPDSGGWSNPGPPSKRVVKGRTKVTPATLQENEWLQLFDLEADPAELNNLYGKYPEVVRTLTEIGQKYIDNGRSTPGAKQKNDVKTGLTPNWVEDYKKKSK
jgi:arylsulfatase A-like enzyme